MRQLLRAMILLSIVLLSAITSIGMQMMPDRTAASATQVEAAIHGAHHGEGPAGKGRGHGRQDCLYCQLAAATDLPPTQGGVTIDLRLHSGTAPFHLDSCDLRTWKAPCQPRAPPSSVAA